MKPFRSLTQRIVQWQQTHLSPTASEALNQLRQQAAVQARRCQQMAKTHLKPAALVALVKHPVHFKRRKYINGKGQRPILLIVAIVSLTSAIGYRFYNDEFLQDHLNNKRRDLQEIH